MQYNLIPALVHQHASQLLIQQLTLTEFDQGTPTAEEVNARIPGCAIKVYLRD